MKIKFTQNTIAEKKIRKKGTTHDIESDEVAGHIIKRGFGEQIETPAEWEKSADDAPKKKKGKKSDDGGADGAAPDSTAAG